MWEPTNGPRLKVVNDGVTGSAGSGEQCGERGGSKGQRQ